MLKLKSNSVKSSNSLFNFLGLTLRTLTAASKLDVVTLRDNTANIMMHIQFISQLITLTKDRTNSFSRILSTTGILTYFCICRYKSKKRHIRCSCDLRCLNTECASSCSCSLIYKHIPLLLKKCIVPICHHGSDLTSSASMHSSFNNRCQRVIYGRFDLG